MLAGLLFVMAMQSAPVAETVLRDMISNVEAPTQASAQTDAEWAALWKLHAGDKALPKVDLKTRTVVAVFLGTRTSAGYSVEITAARPSDGALIVEWEERRPAPGTVSAQIITSPALIATIPKFSGDIRFQKVAR
ncbi:MAG: protease complex subunit PrcB family protein [Vicinamibacterales bacterium]